MFYFLLFYTNVLHVLRLLADSFPCVVGHLHSIVLRRLDGGRQRQARIDIEDSGQGARMCNNRGAERYADGVWRKYRMCARDDATGMEECSAKHPGCRSKVERYRNKFVARYKKRKREHQRYLQKCERYTPWYDPMSAFTTDFLLNCLYGREQIMRDLAKQHLGITGRDAEELIKCARERVGQTIRALLSQAEDS